MELHDFAMQRFDANRTLDLGGAPPKGSRSAIKSVAARLRSRYGA